MTEIVRHPAAGYAQDAVDTLAAIMPGLHERGSVLGLLAESEAVA